jgi:hypothetical protein
MRRKSVWLLLIGIFVFIGCAKVEPFVEDYIDAAKSKGISNEYFAELSKWTRKSVLYSEFETRAYIVATYKSREFRQAYDREYARLYALTTAERDKRALIQSDSADKGTEFVCYFYNPEPKAVDLSRADSIWKVFLLNEKETRLDPIDIRQIKKITPLTEQFYPYVNQYHGKFYSIRFPDAPSGTLKLVFTGVLGRIEIAWP